MRMSSRGLTIVVLVAGCPFDPEIPEFDVITDTDSSSGGSTEPSTTVDPDATVDPDTTDEPSTTVPSTTEDPTEDPTTDTGESVCGDGEVSGSEACDDGTNDGAYGGCMPDCDALAPYCGDSEISDAEVCDDGTNDGSYGGCAAACDALGPNCGDGSLNGDEQCDNGAKNLNSSGCNIDCAISGTVVGTYVEAGLSFCDGTFTTKPAFRENGNALIAVTGYCDDDSVELAEFSPTVDPVQEFGDLLLPATPVREATIAGDTWVLGASGCSYAISPMGDLTEACGPRVTGDSGLDGRDDGSYVALDYAGIAQYPSGSPADGDAADWFVPPPNNATYDYYFNSAALGPSGSSIVVGSRTYIPNGTSTGYLARYTGAGNAAGSNSFAQVQYLAGIAVGGDDSIVVTASYPDYRLMHLGADFNEDWGYSAPAASNILADVDSTGAVVFAYRDNATFAGVLRKWSPDGAQEYWSIEAEAAGFGSQLAIAPDDSIWITAGTGAGYGVVRVSP